MTYDVYAMFREGSYLVASSNDHRHGLDFAEKVCKQLDCWPMGFVSGVRGELKLNGSIFSLNDLKARSN